tara:strand:+ start:38333 stop:39046 length:714 start_codon:yes stop_codon:yes gene_type:complete
MTEQQTNDFALWFEQFMDPELNLTPGDKELCQHAWQAALSHAEGEAVPVAEITIDRHGDAHFKACPNYLDLDQGTYQLYTHPAPQVAGLTETAIKSSPAYRALHREKEHLLGLLKDQAPQVAVPEGWQIKQQEDGVTVLWPDSRGGVHVKTDCPYNLIAEDVLHDLAMAMLAATPAAPAPDEREIAALALERHADNLIVMAERDGRNSDRESQQTWEEAAYFAKQEAARLRAGKEGQ